MRKIENILLLGSAGRNSGKTTLATNLIKKFKNDFNIVGIKVTTIHDKESKCPRGGEGCGVCSSLTENYCIKEEKDLSKNKDTSKMLKAGAYKVYWILSLKDYLGPAFSECLKGIPSKSLIIIESNSLRKYFVPGLFLMLKNIKNDDFKKSAREVEVEVDQFIYFDGDELDFDYNQISIENNSWKLNK